MSLKLIYSEKATKFCEISTLDLSYVTVKSTVAFSEYINFKETSFRITSVFFYVIAKKKRF